MAEQILGQYERRIPIRLKIRIKSQSVFIDFIFVTVNQIRVWMSQDLVRHPKQRMLRERIVGIHERDIFAIRKTKRRVRVSGNMAVSLSVNYANSCICFAKRF